MSSHVHIGLYDALREAGASEEKALAETSWFTWSAWVKWWSAWGEVSRIAWTGPSRSETTSPIGTNSPR